MKNEKNGLPIIFINRGDNFSLWFVLNQAKYFNPNSEIFLIGDETNKKYEKLVKHINIKDYFEKARDFSEYYKHFSPNPHKFELFCLQRWFILFDFMKKNEINECIYLDSDVMVYSNLTNESEKFKKFKMTINDKIFGHCMFVNSLDFLENFCDFIKKTYKEKTLIEIRSEFDDYLEMVKDDKGGISDMTFINAYYKMHKSEIGETGDIINDSIFDNNINNTKNFVVDKNLITNGIKKIRMQKGVPFGIGNKNLKRIRFNIIHFQGDAKRYIPFFYTKKDIIFLFRIIRTFVVFFGGKSLNLIINIPQKITRAFLMLGVRGTINLISIRTQIWFLRKKNFYSNAQLFEDYFLSKLLKNKKNGFYVDIGSNDPNFLNNTKYFYEKGWYGINIEPNPELYKKFIKDRPLDINLCLGIGKKEEVMDFYFFNEDVSSTFSKVEAKKREEYGLKIEKVEKIQVDTLKNILDKFITNKKRIDFLSVDTEGFDLDVLELNDWRRYRPKAICIETSGFRNFYVNKDKSIINFLNSKNYKEVFFNGINSIFIDKNKSK